jgi:hypothetical protein
VPRIVALPGRLDLDDPSPEFGEQQSAVWARQDAGKVYDRDAGERPRLRHNWSSFLRREVRQ